MRLPHPPAYKRIPKAVGLHQYIAKSKMQLTIEKGEQLEVIDKVDDDKWWKVRSLRTGKQGFVPSNSVAPVQTIGEQQWFYGNLTKVDAEWKVSQAGNPTGTFLVRESESGGNPYVLSVRDGDSVKHYNISNTEAGDYYIAEGVAFRSLEDLVEHYQKDADGLCCRLTNTCSTVIGE